MEVIVNNVFLKLNDDESLIENKLLMILKIPKEELISYKVIKKAIDARKKDNIIFVYSLLVNIKNPYMENNVNVQISKFKEDLEIPIITMEKRPIIVGFGPAGMFLALYLARAKTRPIVIERGKSVDKRIKDVESMKKEGKLITNSNVCFGEGGAGTFSDGKLNTGIKDSRIRFCLNEFIKHGAPNEIYYQAHPHVGSDKLREVVKNIRQEIIDLGGEIRFESQLVDFKKEKHIEAIIKDCNRQYSLFTDDLILAIGHSARDTYQMLLNNKVNMKAKDFSLGVRVEHLQEEVNKSQYGKFYKSSKLPNAEYKLVVHLANGRTLYSFCMCPGGEVVASNSEEQSIVTNGMSYYKRDLDNANSALLVDVRVADYFINSPLDGIRFQQKYECLAFNKNYPYFAPVQKVGDFIHNVKTRKIGRVKPSYKPGYYFEKLDNVLPPFVSESLRLGLQTLRRKYEFFKDDDAILTGVETRSSSPIKIPRDEQGVCNISGVYPCGEGASYAGGIMSAAIDGLKIGECIKNKYQK